ncbi:hypothetical protein PPL_01471 [Heterostelium album PN500]|uniref:D-serine dehydratase n=1 Tax=Heterostelium pallidum (strain ATCC 26659 / Pp 5 / PN500) TaxID=670386 RepID=D3AZD1_HETP5|nr:hypothetical protein PPL_01471 [Heterostelium album PN500]EFA85514.1 hypothetical protein PPL_01471 [Heterostelium album PN500]|eukprot:XP_020437622.1 hypothetical protein PPL_01471 [Heterostelium album PN500]
MQNISIKQLPSPSVVVDEEIVRRNCKKMIDRSKQLGVAIRPHMKTHKTIEIGKFQVEGLEFKKVIVSTLQEAKFYAQSGYFKDILYAIPIAPNKLEQAASIHSSIDVLHLMVDHPDHVRALVDFRVSNNAALAGKKWSVFVKIDCGYHRAGADPCSPKTLDLIASITKDNNQHFDFQGIYTHSGHSYRQQTPKEIAAIALEEATVAGQMGARIREAGLPCPIVSIGSTPSSDPAKPIDFSRYPIGTVIQIIPNHSCLTAAMFSNYQILKGITLFELT